jgi:predicted nucleic acid-binding protein
MLVSKKVKKSKKNEFVLDCTVTMAWFFEDETVSYADRVRRALAHTEAVVPNIWPLEVANTLLMGERRKRSNAYDATKWLTYLRLLPIRSDPETASHAWEETLDLARSRDLTIYDACYLELALRLALPLASLDESLNAAAEASGVDLFRP